MNPNISPISESSLTKAHFLRAILIFFFLFSFLFSRAQTGIHGCGSDIMRQKNFNENPRTKHKNDSIEHVLLLAVQQKLQQEKTGILRSPMQIYVIPVVIHIIHNNGSENISDAQVIAGIQDMNDAFRNVGVFNPNTGVDVEIEFCLAKQDENGNYTTGINRVVSPLTNVTMETDDINLKNLIRWDPTKYLNIWIVKEITSQTMGPSVVGYAYFPSSHGNPEDGIVNEAYYFGTSPDNSKVAVHEAGHYLGLYHTFEGGCSNNNCLTDGDQVCDTPPDASTAPVSCNATVNTCATDDDDLSANNPFRPAGNGGTGDQNDMFIDYMDYGDLVCYSAFTPGQKNRMILSLTGVRSSLLQSIGCNNTCTSFITASFNASAINVTAGTTVSFTNTSSGSVNNTWQLNGTAFSTATNSSYTFNIAGTYTVKLIAANSNPGCTEEFAITITVTCPVTASFTSSATEILPGGNVTFTNTSTGATTYQWYLDGSAQGTTVNFSHTFPTNGGFMTSLIVSNGICSDTAYQYIAVGMCKSKEANIWYFGDSAAVDFNSGIPVAISGSAMLVNEGCASIADQNGSLLFYTNGVSVWDKTNTQMPNGFGLNGGSYGSSDQGAIIVPQPGSTSLYYIFTLDEAENNYVNGSCYSLLDMTLNGGKGDVTIKNTFLHQAYEQQTATKHCNGQDVWLIIGNCNSVGIDFYAYLVTSTGVSNTPIQSIINTGLMGGGGYLKVSPDGTRLAMGISNGYSVQLFDFDNSTGIVSNPISVVSTIPNEFLAYSIEFSPDGTKLYASLLSAVSIVENSSIYQYNLLAGSATDIHNSAVEIANTPGENYEALQLGPDGKIYIARAYYAVLGCINYPNALGVNCGFISNAVPFLGMAFRGLPGFIQSTFYEPSIKGLDTVCSNTQNITYSVGGCAGSVSWFLHGLATVVSSTNSTAILNFNGAGKDTLIAEITRACGITKDTFLISVLPSPNLELGVDTLICQGNSVTLNAGAGFATYLWQDGSFNQTYTVNAPGQYKVTVTNNNGCTAADSITVNYTSPVTPLNLGPDIFSCKGGIVVLDAGSGFSSYHWQNGSSNQKYTVYNPGKYWVTVSACGTTTSDTITVTWQSNISFSIAQEGDLCAGQSVALKADPTDLASYLWDDGSGTYTRDVQNPGTYWLIVTDTNGCYDQDSMVVLLRDCNCVIAVPTAFSPNNDGHNDLFILHGFENCVTKFSMIIFNRWGEKVFESNEAASGWNGTFNGNPVNPDVFVYFIKATLNNGEKIIKKGNISLIR